MKLFGREIKKEDIDVDKLLGSPVFKSMFGVNMDKKDYKETTLITSLRILSDGVSKLPLKVHEGNDTAENHLLNKMLKLRPNKLMSASTLWRTIEYQRNWYGYSVVAIGRDRNGRATSLIPLKMDDVTVYVDDVGLLENKDVPMFFTYQQNGNEYQFFYEDVLYFLGMTKDGLDPMPIREQLQTLIENASESQRFTNVYLKNGLHARGVVKYIGDLDEASQTKLQERMTRVSGGIEKAGQLLPLPIGFDYQSISTSLADSQFVELQALSERQIASAFGVKMHQLNSLDRSTHSNIEHQQKEFYMDTLQPILTAYEQEMSYKLLTEKEIDEGFFIRFNVDAMLRSDIKTRYEAYNIGIQGGMLKPDEARGKENLPPEPGGDKLYFNGNMIPVTMAGQQYMKGGEGDGQNGD
ncbi:phage portal protein [Oceanobacillus profundus]|uniref:phage portal protein n=1 Tax=Oceanobacillus TaxID=182709 RepID=UPI0026E2B7A2|nr:phage portal protein [Oceanobacillus profundus]MDO6448093.1 phage portal protein [Oceanobacillus profundus]